MASQKYATSTSQYVPTFPQITLVVEIAYTNDLQDVYVPTSYLSKTVEEDFRAALQAIGVLPPKRDTITVVSPGVIHTSWNVQEHSTFHHSLSNRFKGHGRYKIEQNLERLSIKWVELHEIKDDALPVVTVVFPSTGRYSHPNKATLMDYAAPTDIYHYEKPGQTSEQGTLLDRVQSKTLADRLLSSSTVPEEPLDQEEEGEVDDGECMDQEEEAAYADTRARWSEPTVVEGDHPHPPSRSPSQEPKNKRWKRTEYIGSPPGKRTLEHDLFDQLKAEQRKSARLEQKLKEAIRRGADARMKNKAYEMMLEDIRRECRTPFVVPSLFDAFLEITQVTNAAIHS